MGWITIGHVNPISVLSENFPEAYIETTDGLSPNTDNFSTNSYLKYVAGENNIVTCKGISADSRIGDTITLENGVLKFTDAPANNVHACMYFSFGWTVAQSIIDDLVLAGASYIERIHIVTTDGLPPSSDGSNINLSASSIKYNGDTYPLISATSNAALVIDGGNLMVPNTSGLSFTIINENDIRFILNEDSIEVWSSEFVKDASITAARPYTLGAYVPATLEFFQKLSDGYYYVECSVSETTNNRSSTTLPYQITPATFTASATDIAAINAFAGETIINSMTIYLFKQDYADGRVHDFLFSCISYSAQNTSITTSGYSEFNEAANLLYIKNKKLFFTPEGNSDAELAGGVTWSGFGSSYIAISSGNGSTFISVCVSGNELSADVERKTILLGARPPVTGTPPYQDVHDYVELWRSSTPIPLNDGSNPREMMFLTSISCESGAGPRVVTPSTIQYIAVAESTKVYYLFPGADGSVLRIVSPNTNNLNNNYDLIIDEGASWDLEPTLASELGMAAKFVTTDNRAPRYSETGVCLNLDYTNSTINWDFGGGAVDYPITASRTVNPSGEYALSVDSAGSIMMETYMYDVEFETSHVDGNLKLSIENGSVRFYTDTGSGWVLQSSYAISPTYEFGVVILDVEKFHRFYSAPENSGDGFGVYSWMGLANTAHTNNTATVPSNIYIYDQGTEITLSTFPAITLGQILTFRQYLASCLYAGSSVFSGFIDTDYSLYSLTQEMGAFLPYYIKGGSFTISSDQATYFTFTDIVPTLNSRLVAKHLDIRLTEASGGIIKFANSDESMLWQLAVSGSDTVLTVTDPNDTYVETYTGNLFNDEILFSMVKTPADFQFSMGADAPENQPVTLEITTLTFSDFASTSQGDFFFFSRSTGITWAIWLDKDDNGTQPSGQMFLAAENRIKVSIYTGYTADDVADAVFTAISGTIGASVGADYPSITITSAPCRDVLSANAAENSSGSISVTVDQQGSSVQFGNLSSNVNIGAAFYSITAGGDWLCLDGSVVGLADVLDYETSPTISAAFKARTVPIKMGSAIAHKGGLFSLLDSEIPVTNLSFGTLTIDTNSIAENSPEDSLVGTIDPHPAWTPSGLYVAFNGDYPDDEACFALVESGGQWQLRTAIGFVPDYETKTSYTLSLYAADDYETGSVANITIDITNVSATTTSVTLFDGKAIVTLDGDPTETEEILINGNPLEGGSVVRNTLNTQKFLKKATGGPKAYAVIPIEKKAEWGFPAGAASAWAILQSK